MVEQKRLTIDISLKTNNTFYEILKSKLQHFIRLNVLSHCYTFGPSSYPQCRTSFFFILFVYFLHVLNGTNY